MPHRWNPIAPPVTGLVPPVRVDATGRAGPTRGQARGPGWRQTAPGLYVPASAPTELVEQRVLEASVWAGPRAVVTGWSSLRLHGAGFFDGRQRDGAPLPVTLAANGGRVRKNDVVRVVDDRIPPDEITVIHGIRCAVPERALFDEMRRIGEVREMAVAVGAACAARLVTVRGVRLYASTRRWYRDVRMVREAVEMAIEGCRSPQEDRFRLVWEYEDRFRLVWEYDAGWGRPLVNWPVLTLDGRLVAVPDLIDPDRGVVGEYAGADHRDIDRHEADIAREAALRGVGLEYVEVVARDLYDRRRIIRRMEEAAARAVHLERRWQLAPSRHPKWL